MCTVSLSEGEIDITAKLSPFRVISNWTQATLPSSNAFEPTANAREHLTLSPPVDFEAKD